MGRISIKDNELVALLPKHLRESKLTGAAKLILGDLLFLYGRDFAKENGFVFRTNQDLMNDTGIKCGNTLIKTLRKLEINGFINRTGGKRNKASEYRLNMDKINDDSNINGIQYNNDNSNYTITEMNTMNTRLESIEKLLSEKFDTMIEILQKIQYNNDNLRYNNDNLRYNNDNSNCIEYSSNYTLSSLIILQKQTQSTDKETFYMDHTGISSIDEINYSSENKSKYIKHNDISSITSEEENNILKEMKDNKISGPEVNVVANNENNGMNDNTKNNNIQPLQVPASDTSDTSTVPLSGDDGIGGMVPSVEENNIQPVQDRTSDTSDTPTVSLSGNEGMEVVSDSTNSESTATNGDDKTHTTSEDNTNSTEANTGRLAHGTETLQHPAYSSAKPSKICIEKGAAAVGGVDFGAAQKSCETASNTPTVEQLPTSTEKVDNIAPSYSDTESNSEFDMFYAQHGCTREEYEEIQRSFHKSNWMSLPCKFKGQTIPISKALGKLNEENKEGKKPLEANTYFFIVDRLNACANRHVKEGNMNDTEFQEFQNAIEFESKRFFAYWMKTFENRKPYEERPSEKRMYDLLVQMGRIGEKQSEKTDITSIPTVNTVDTDFEDEMAYLDFESGTMTKKRSTTA